MGAIIVVILAAVIGIFVAIQKWRKTEAKKTEQQQLFRNIAATKETFVQDKEEEKTVSVNIPSRMDNLYLIYSYTNIKFSPSDNAPQIADAMKKNAEFELTIQERDGAFYAIYDAAVFGEILDRTDMIQDWLHRGDPIRCWVKEYGLDENILALAFYRDEHARLAHRESGVYRLTKYANQGAQDMMAFYHDGDKVDLSEDMYEECAVSVESIGYLPKKAAQRYIDEGAAAAFIDHIDYDVDKEKDIPYVKIYW